MPISKFQSDVLRLLAAQRSPDSYIAGGVAINRAGPRISADIDIFHDSQTLPAVLLLPTTSFIGSSAPPSIGPILSPLSVEGGLQIGPFRLC